MSEVWEFISNSIAHFKMDATMLVLKLIHASKNHLGLFSYACKISGASADYIIPRRC